MKEKLLALLTDKPQSRELLCIKLQVSDRKLRKAVEDLRREGYPICSSSHRTGYWMGDTADRKVLVREYRARGAKMFELANKLEAGAGREQVRWNV